MKINDIFYSMNEEETNQEKETLYVLASFTWDIVERNN